MRQKLAEMAVDNEMRGLIGWHGQWWQDQRMKLGPKPYDFSGFCQKKYTTKHAEMMMDIMGTYGQLTKGSKWVKKVGPTVDVEGRWQTARSLHAAGTWEVNKIVLAARGLGLPRIPAKFNTMIMEALQERS